MPPQRGCQINLQTVSSLSTSLHQPRARSQISLHLTAAKLVNILFASSNGSYLVRPYLPILYTRYRVYRFQLKYYASVSIIRGVKLTLSLSLFSFFLVHSTTKCFLILNFLERGIKFHIRRIRICTIKCKL